MKTKSRYQNARKLLLFWCLFIAIGAVGGAAVMLYDPSGEFMGMPLYYFQKLPFADILFSDLTFSAYALLTVNGLSNLFASYLLIKQKPHAEFFGGLFGVTLMLWICIQFYMFPPNIMSTLYFIFGFCQAASGYAASVFKKQENFYFSEADYPNVGTNKKELVVYFSRMGYVKKIAYETADKTGADIYEIKAKEKTEGTIGFWWCGRFGMCRMDMPIYEPQIDISSYQKVTVCSPIWVFALSSPVRTFCKMYHCKIKKVSYILLHHTSGVYENAADEMDELLGIKRESLVSIICRKGEFKKVYEK